MNRHLISIIIILLTGLCAGAQQGRQFSFSQYNTNTGAFSNQVNSVTQDSAGYIWTATTEGLQRFDGTRYRIFRHSDADPHSLTTNPVTRVKVDRRGNLWVLLANGDLGIFDTHSFRFIPARVTVKDPTWLYTHKELKMDEEGNMILLLRGETFLTWHRNNNEFSEAHNFITLTDSMKVYDIIHQPGTKKYWISTSQGLAIYNKATGRLSYQGFNRENEKAVEDFSDLGITGHYFFDSRGRLWFDSWMGGGPAAYAYNTGERRFEVFRHSFRPVTRSYYEIHGFFEQSDRTIWVLGLGIFSKYIDSTRSFEQVYNGQRNGRSIFYDAVQDLYEDREENVWVATKNHGLYRFNPGHDFFTNVGHTVRTTGDVGNGSVMSFIETKWKTLLVGTWADGIYEYDRDLRLVPTSIRGLDPKGGPTIWCMTLSRDGNTIWMGGQPGVAKLDQASRTLTHYYDPPALMNKTVRQVAEDASGKLWLGLQTNGLYKWNPAKGRTDFNAGISQSFLVPPGTINKLVVDSEGLLWVGTSTQGLYVIDPIAEKVLFRFHLKGEKDFALPEPGVSSVLPYDDSLVVITTGTHVLKYNRKTRQLKNFGPGEGLSGFIASMEKDRNGYIWLTTTSGLYRINLLKGIFIRFTREDGIDNDNFVLNASYALPGGKLAFGSSNEFIIFDPSHMLSHQLKPEVYITDFNVLGKSLRLDSLQQLDIVRLRAKQNSVIIEFSPLRYAVSYQVRYKLEGLDENWKNADRRNNQAVYSYLPGGNYTLRIQAVNEEGQLGDETVLRLRITPPFWKSWWFLTGVVLFIAAILFFLDKERMKRKEALQKMRTDISNNLHGEVNTALNNINILSEMARLKSTKDPEKAEEYIEQIHTKSHNMIIVMDDMLWSLDPANDNMRKTVERMQEYIEALNNRHGAYIDMAVDRNVEQLKLNMKLRHDAFLLFKEGIQNLVQTGVSICHIRLGLEKQQLVFSMEFDTETTDMQQLNNLFHRHDMEKRIDNMNAEMEVDVHKNSTTVILKIPLY